MGSKFSRIRPGTNELPALERLEKLMDNVVTALAPKFLIGSSSFFYVIRTTIKAWVSLQFCRIGPGTYALAAFEHLEKSP